MSLIDRCNAITNSLKIFHLSRENHGTLKKDDFIPIAQEILSLKEENKQVIYKNLFKNIIAQVRKDTIEDLKNQLESAPSVEDLQDLDGIDFPTTKEELEIKIDRLERDDTTVWQLFQSLINAGFPHEDREKVTSQELNAFTFLERVRSSQAHDNAPEPTNKRRRI